MPLVSFDLHQKYYDAIREGMDKGEWNTLSEAIRSLIKEGFKQEQFAIYLKKEEEKQTTDDHP